MDLYSPMAMMNLEILNILVDDSSDSDEDTAYPLLNTSLISDDEEGDGKRT